MSEIKVFVVEDESIVSKDIQQSLKRLGYQVCGSASSGEKAIEGITEAKPDVILMDIMLKGEMTGIETADIIKQSIHTPVIFLTAYADNATLEKAKKIQPYGYIIKPFKEVDLHTSIELAIYKHKKIVEVEKERDFLFSIVENKDNAPNDFIFVKSNSQFVKINLKEIMFIEALKDYVVINLLNKRYTIYSTMKDIYVKLGAVDFVRIHRSFIIRLDKISSIDYPNLRLDGIDKFFPIGGSYKEDLMKRIELF